MWKWWRTHWHGLALVLLLAACNRPAVNQPPGLAGGAEAVTCREYGSSIDARRIAEDWIAEHKSRFQEVIHNASWENDLWSIGFALRSDGKQGFAAVTLLPSGEVVRCETARECVVTPTPRLPTCPAAQKRVATEQQAIEIAAHFLMQQAIQVDDRTPPEIYSRPAWWVFVVLEPPTPGGHYILLISANGKVVGIIPGE